MGKSWKRLVQRRRRAASEVEAAPVAEEAPAAAPKVVKPAPAKKAMAAPAKKAKEAPKKSK